MVVRLQVAMAGAPLLKRRVKMRVPDETTVQKLLALYVEKYKVKGLFDSLSGLSVLVNGSRASFKQVLKENDDLKIFRPMIKG